MKYLEVKRRGIIDRLWYDDSDNPDRIVEKINSLTSENADVVVVDGLSYFDSENFGISGFSIESFKLLQDWIFDPSIDIDSKFKAAQAEGLYVRVEAGNVDAIAQSLREYSEVNFYKGVPYPYYVKVPDSQVVKDICAWHQWSYKLISVFGADEIDSSAYYPEVREYNELKRKNQLLMEQLTPSFFAKISGLPSKVDKLTEDVETCETMILEDRGTFNHEASVVNDKLSKISTSLSAGNELISENQVVLKDHSEKLSDVLSISYDFREWSSNLSQLIRSVTDLKASLVYSYNQFVSEALSASELKHNLLQGVAANIEQIERLNAQFAKFTQFNASISDLIVQLKANIAEAELILSYAPTQEMVRKILSRKSAISDIKDVSEIAKNIRDVLPDKKDSVWD